MSAQEGHRCSRVLRESFQGVEILVGVTVGMFHAPVRVTLNERGNHKISAFEQFDSSSFGVLEVEWGSEKDGGLRHAASFAIVPDAAWEAAKATPFTLFTRKVLPFDDAAEKVWWARCHDL